MKTLPIEIVEDGQMPTRATDGSAGFDVYARITRDVTVYPDRAVKIPVGFKLEPDPNVAVLVLPRSGLATKQGVAPINSPGLGDWDFRNEYAVTLTSHSTRAYTIQPGDRIAQLLFVPCFTPELIRVSEVGVTDRAGGWGSTGR